MKYVLVLVIIVALAFSSADGKKNKTTKEHKKQDGHEHTQKSTAEVSDLTRTKRQVPTLMQSPGFVPTNESSTSSPDAPTDGPKRGGRKSHKKRTGQEQQ